MVKTLSSGADVDEAAGLISGIPGYDPIATAGDCDFSLKEAMRAVRFFPEFLVHVKGQEHAGKPFMLEKWQEAIVANLFGWFRPDGTRRYRECLIFVPKKNGKTTLAAGLICRMLFDDNEPGAELYSAAGEGSQARVVFDIAKQMIRKNLQLSSKCRIYQHSIMIDAAGVIYKPFSREAVTKHGFNPSFMVIDELHAHRDRELVDTLLGSTGARRQPLTVMLTTSDYDRPSICNEKYERARRIRDGLVDDPSFLPVIFEASREDDWTDPTVWDDANPNMNVAVHEEFYKHKCEEAQGNATLESKFKRFYLNIKTEQSDPLISLPEWDACGDAFDPKELDGQLCYGGLDLANTSDITALALVFPIDELFYVLMRYWIPAEGAEQRYKKDGVPYLDWSADGLVELTEGNTIDQRVIRQRIVEYATQYSLQELAFDPYGAPKISTELEKDDGIEMVQFRQGMLSMGPGWKETERLIKSKALRHNSDPVLRWMAGNAVGRTDHLMNTMPYKKKSTEKIDGIVALVMAVARATQNSDGGEIDPDELFFV